MASASDLAAIVLMNASKGEGVSSSIPPSRSNCLAGPQADQMSLAAVQTAHHIERIGIVARRLFNQEAAHT